MLPPGHRKQRAHAVASVADDVHDLGVGEHRQQLRDVADVVRALVTPAGLSGLGCVGGEDRSCDRADGSGSPLHRLGHVLAGGWPLGQQGLRSRNEPQSIAKRPVITQVAELAALPVQPHQETGLAGDGDPGVPIEHELKHRCAR